MLAVTQSMRIVCSLLCDYFTKTPSTVNSLHNRNGMKIKIILG